MIKNKKVWIIEELINNKWEISWEGYVFKTRESARNFIKYYKLLSLSPKKRRIVTYIKNENN